MRARSSMTGLIVPLDQWYTAPGEDFSELARRYFTGYPPSSPTIAILRDGKLVYMMERHQIEKAIEEGRHPV